MDNVHIKGFLMMREMVRQQDIPKLNKLIREEERRMGLVPSNLDDAYETSEAAKASSGGGGLLMPGEYTGVVVEAAVGESMKPWVTAELKLKLQVTTEGSEKDKFTFCDIELAPNTNKNGEPSPGKLKFVKGQLVNGLGFEGKLSEVEYNVDKFLGAVIEFRQKVDNHLDENGQPDEWARMNPNTNLPYIDREVYLNKLVTPGFGAGVTTGQAPATPAIY
jgi:hypothetical protein